MNLQVLAMQIAWPEAKAVRLGIDGDLQPEYTGLVLRRSPSRGSTSRRPGA